MPCPLLPFLLRLCAVGDNDIYIMQVYPRLFRNFHRQVFCWLDEWHDLSMDDIRRLEEETREELNKVRIGGVYISAGRLLIADFAFNFGHFLVIIVLVGPMRDGA